jgi:hypothetical protein
MATNLSDQHARAGADDPPRPSTGGRSAILRRPWVTEVAWLAATMAITLIVVAWVLQLWHAKLHVPITPGGDATLNLAVLQGMIEHGWYFTNSSLGAPAGQQLYDFSAFDGDNLQFLFMRVLALGISDPAALLNVYYILGFALVSGATYGVLRAVGVSRPTACVGGVLLAVLPEHFARSESHLFLATFFAVPAGGWLVLRTLLGQPLATRRPDVAGWRGWMSWPLAATVAACIAAGGSTLYYAVFTILLVGIAALLRGVSVRSPRAVLPGILLAAAVGVVLLVNISPALIYQEIHGHNPASATRQPVESEAYAMSLIQMVLPIQGHRIQAFAEAYQKHQGTTPLVSEGGQQIGLLFALSFFGLIALMAGRALAGARAVSERGTLAAAAAVGAGTAFLLGTFGGGSALIAYLVSPQIRAWNRIVPFIAFFALVGLALAIDAARDRLGTVSRRRILAGALVVLVGVVGVLDQTSKTFLPAYAATFKTWQSDARFAADLDRLLPNDAMVFQLPFHEFPETTGTNQMADYDLFKGYVHNSHLRWSYGAMKGRSQDWGDEAAAEPLSFVVPAAMAEGFAGVYVDRGAYADQGQAVEAQIRKALGVAAPALVSADGRLAFYDGRPLGQRLAATLPEAQRHALGQALVDPVQVTFGAGFYPEEVQGDKSFRWAATDATTALDNPDKAPRKVVFEATARVGARGTVQIALPGQAPRTIRFISGQQHLRLPFVAPPGKSAITLHADVPRQGGTVDARDLRVQLFSARVVDDVPIPKPAP